MHNVSRVQAVLLLSLRSGYESLVYHACWTLVRKHKTIKKRANPQHNTRTFEQHILEEVLCTELAATQCDGLFEHGPSLLKPHNASAKLRAFVSQGLNIVFDSPDECLTSSTARIQPTGLCHWKDVALIKFVDGHQHWEAAEVWHHFTIGGRHITLVSRWQLVEYNPAQSVASWQSQYDPMFIELADILCCLTYQKDSRGLVTTLIPYQFRY